MNEYEFYVYLREDSKQQWARHEAWREEMRRQQEEWAQQNAKRAEEFQTVMAKVWDDIANGR